ncbi:MAG TPA: nitrogen regulation protein NR(I) [Marinobacter adhaerens]|nr:nitrogen regulation protein NR(I) [Marinobacter adhaerens]
MSQPANVWIIDDDRSIRWVLERALNQAGMQPRVFDSGESIMMRLEHEQPDAIVSDIRMPGVDGITLLSQIVDVHPDVPVIIMTAHSDLESAVTSYQTGAFEYLPKPFDVDDAVALVKRAVAHSHEKRASGEPQAEMAQRNAEIIGEAPAMQEVFRAIGRLSHSNITVLINGESGTGKELVAQALHNHSPRANHPFIALNMAAIPKDLIESELFGHEKGAFTGAGAARQGRFEQANGGTLFLDEIGDMPLALQSKLLRVLESRQFRPLGAREEQHSDFRLVAATHQPLQAGIEDGSFRRDLFYRLSQFPLRVTPLRERPEDLEALSRHFIRLYTEREGSGPMGISSHALHLLAGYDFPGNVRELRNIIELACLQTPGGDDIQPEVLRINDLFEEPDGWTRAPSDARDRNPVDLPAVEEVRDLKVAAQAFEAAIIRERLRQYGGNRAQAAESLGLPKRTLAHKCLKYRVTES